MRLVACGFHQTANGTKARASWTTAAEFTAMTPIFAKFAMVFGVHTRRR
jgi:hypothetical protein